MGRPRGSAAFGLSGGVGPDLGNMGAAESGTGIHPRKWVIAVRGAALQPGRLIGREPELAAAGRQLLLPDARLLTLSGPSGSGKTRLAIALAESVAGRF